MLSVGSLFSGIGGIDLGLERTGHFRTVWFSEIAPYQSSVLKARWPDVPNLGDVTLIQDPPQADVLVGGFPCQPASKAGKRRGRSDERWLWPAFAGVIRQVRPRYAVMENVPGLLSVDGGAAFGEVLGDLASLGYHAVWDSLPAAAVGAPHARDRIWIVAYTDADRPGFDRRWHDAAKHHLAKPKPGRLADPLGPEIPALGSLLARQPEGPWDSEPAVGRVAYGLPDGVDRLACLGNAVVPQVAELVGRCIIEAGGLA